MVAPLRLAALLAVVGLLAFANPLWLVPHADETHYTYERSQIETDDGTLDYRGDSMRQFHHENDLVDVDCQVGDAGGRACAFDRHLRDDGPVTLSEERTEPIEFVSLDDGYYRRTVTANGSGATYDVEAVTVAELLEAIAYDLSDVSPASLDDEDPVEYHVAVSGETETAYERADADDLGRVYERNGTYYTVVLTDTTTTDPRFVSSTVRDGLSFVGLVALFAAVLFLARWLERVEKE